MEGNEKGNEQVSDVEEALRKKKYAIDQGKSSNCDAGQKEDEEENEEEEY
jgi:hypothetical protein